MKLRKVTRKWYSKKLNKNIVKKYYYVKENKDWKRVEDSNSINRLLNIESDKRNYIFDKNLNFKENIKVNELKNKYGDLSVEIELESLKKDIQYNLIPRTKVTFKYLKSRLADNKLERFFINLGYTPQELLEEVNKGVSDDKKISLDEINTLDNWKNNQFFSPSTGRYFKVIFRYDGSPLIEE